jgi:hypothetical protein
MEAALTEKRTFLSCADTGEAAAMKREEAKQSTNLILIVNLPGK